MKVTQKIHLHTVIDLAHRAGHTIMTTLVPTARIDCWSGSDFTIDCENEAAGAAVAAAVAVEQSGGWH